VLAPIPSAIVTIAVTAKTGLFRSARAAILKSRIAPPVAQAIQSVLRPGATDAQLDAQTKRLLRSPQLDGIVLTPSL